ncbi:hypothetical protein IFT64_02285 [Oxalobacteraceae sp. CFBP 8753]|nr:hypothetical protein [Oxalobacteraceae sp. CFBP 8753]
MAVLLDECSYDLKRRSSSAWAKNALAKRRISLALQFAVLSFQCFHAFLLGLAQAGREHVSVSVGASNDAAFQAYSQFWPRST